MMQQSMHDAIHKNVKLRSLTYCKYGNKCCRCTSLCIVVVSHCLSSFVIVTKGPPSLRTAKKTSDVWCKDLSRRMRPQKKNVNL